MLDIVGRSTDPCLRQSGLHASNRLVSRGSRHNDLAEKGVKVWRNDCTSGYLSDFSSQVYDIGR